MQLVKYILLIIGVVALAACGNTTANSNDDTLKMYTTVYPLEYIISELGGHTVEVESIIPLGADSHTYEPTSQEMTKYANGDGVVYVGESMEAFSENIADALGNQNTELIKIGDHSELFSGSHVESTGHEHEATDDIIEGRADHYHTGDTVELNAVHEGDKVEWAVTNDNDEFETVSNDEMFTIETGENSFSVQAIVYADDEVIAKDIVDIEVDNHDSFDPHIWIDPLKMIEVAEILRDTLIKLNEDEAALYNENFDVLADELTKLDTEFTEVLADKNNAKIIVPHAAFGYWERYGVEQIPVSGLSMSDEPSQQQLTELLEIAKDNNLNYVLYEQNSTGRISEIIQEQIGAESEKIHNMEVLTEEDISNEENYLSLMRENLEMLDKVTE